jgi:hypothetical protein
MRRAVTSSDAAAAAASRAVDPDQLADLRTRLAHLEQMVQGLQDSVYRESQRHDKRISELEMQLDPATIAAALSKDARERGL